MRRAVATVLAFVVAGAVAASDPSSDRRFEFEESTLEKTRAAMKRLHIGMDVKDAERMLPLKSMKLIGMHRGNINTTCAYQFDKDYWLVLWCRAGSTELIAAVLSRREKVIEKLTK